jgi:putative ABC transport system ATP-binding protein
VLADEPTGALDSSTGEAIMRVLRARVDAGAAGLLVTHEPQHAAWADRIVFLRDGAVVDVASGGSSTAPLFALEVDLDEEPSR